MFFSSFNNSSLILNGFLKNIPKFMIFQNDSYNNSLYNLNRNSDISEKNTDFVYLKSLIHIGR